MAKCDFCEKGIRTGHRISINRSQVSRRANRTWKPNIKSVRVLDVSGDVKRVHICTRCLRSGKVNRAL